MTEAPNLTHLRMAAGRLGNTAEIQAITLRQLQWNTHELGLEVGEEPNIHPTVNMAHGLRGAVLRYQVRATFTGIVAAGELFRVDSVHDVLFRIPEGDSPSEEELESFGVLSVFFMVYPYLRQELQQLTVNAGLPPVLLRPFRIPFNPATGEAHGSKALSSGGPG